MKYNRFHFLEFIGSGLIRLSILWTLFWGIKPTVARCLPRATFPPQIRWYFALPDAPIISGKPWVWSLDLWPLLLGLLVLCAGGYLMIWASYKSQKQGNL